LWYSRFWFFVPIKKIGLAASAMVYVQRTDVPGPDKSREETAIMSAINVTPIVRIEQLLTCIAGLRVPPPDATEAAQQLMQLLKDEASGGRVDQMDAAGFLLFAGWDSASGEPAPHALVDWCTTDLVPVRSVLQAAGYGAAWAGHSDALACVLKDAASVLRGADGGADEGADEGEVVAGVATAAIIGVYNSPLTSADAVVIDVRVVAMMCSRWLTSPGAVTTHLLLELCQSTAPMQHPARARMLVAILITLRERLGNDAVIACFDDCRANIATLVDQPDARNAAGEALQAMRCVYEAHLTSETITGVRAAVMQAIAISSPPSSSA
jgi:hypothetical protein